MVRLWDMLAQVSYILNLWFYTFMWDLQARVRTEKWRIFGIVSVLLSSWFYEVQRRMCVWYLKFKPWLLYPKPHWLAACKDDCGPGFGPSPWAVCLNGPSSRQAQSVLCRTGPGRNVPNRAQCRPRPTGRCVHPNFAKFSVFCHVFQKSCGPRPMTLCSCRAVLFSFLSRASDRLVRQPSLAAWRYTILNLWIVELHFPHSITTVCTTAFVIPLIY